jgi:hypothetical protein
MEKKVVNFILYTLLNSKVYQNKQYLWGLKGSKDVETKTTILHKKVDTPLANLVKYYLECLSHDDLGGVSVFASSNYDLDYCELETIPLLEAFLKLPSAISRV